MPGASAGPEQVDAGVVFVEVVSPEALAPDLLDIELMAKRGAVHTDTRGLPGPRRAQQKGARHGTVRRPTDRDDQCQENADTQRFTHGMTTQRDAAGCGPGGIVPVRCDDTCWRAWPARCSPRRF